ncbi:MAG: dTMP kinase [Candidatus Bathyarchaeia archaeon]
MCKKGLFICIEGLDASGKTTQSKLLVEKLREKGIPSRYTMEPSEGEVGQLIRSFILKRDVRTHAAIEALLFAADRLDHIGRDVSPALARGEVVVSDRYVYSSLAYQGGVNLDLHWVEEINKFALKPDLAIYIDVPPEVAVERLTGGRSVMENLETQELARKIYLQMVKDRKLILVDGNRDIDEVSKEILNIVMGFLKDRGFFIKEGN